MVLLVGEAERTLDFRRRVDETAQRVSRQRVVVAAGRDEFEAAGFAVAAFGIASVEQETLDLVRRVRDHFLLGELGAIGLEPRAEVPRVDRAVLILHLTEDENLAGAEYIGRQPVESR